MTSSIRIYHLIGLIVVFGAAGILLGEIFLLLGYAVIPILVFARWSNHKRAAWATALLFGAAFCLHLWGFKIFGSARVADLEFLRKPRRIAALVPPNVIRFDDGSTGSVQGIFFPRQVELSEGLFSHYESFRPFQNIHMILEHGTRRAVGIQVELTEPTNRSSGAMYLQRQAYWCGNTWSPHFFPRRLPRNVRTDLAPVLVWGGLAFPTADHVSNAPRGHDSLLRALDRTVVPDLPQQHAEIERLASALFGRQQWAKGLELLIVTGATNAMSQARTVILNEFEISMREERSNPQRSNEWMTLLLQIDPQAAGQALIRLLSDADFDVDKASSLAGAMASLGDITGFDLLVARLGEGDLKARSLGRLSLLLESWFRFDLDLNGVGQPKDTTQEFLDWHCEIRSRLSYRRLTTGRQGFALDAGVPFGSAYYESMRPFKDRIAQRHRRTIHKYRFYETI